MKKLLGFAAVLFMVVLSAGFSMAEEQHSHAVKPPATDEAPKPVIADELKDVKVSGYVSAGITGNLNAPHSRAVQMRPFNPTSNDFSVDLAQLVFRKDTAEPGTSGFRLDLDYGYTVPQAIHAAESPASTGDVVVQQALISHIFKLGSGLKVDLGKFNTEVGSEVTEGVDDAGWNYSHSFTAVYSAPGSHTGMKLHYDFNDKFAVAACVINGWDNMQDNNNSKSYLLHADIRPIKDVTLHLMYLGGPEKTNNTKDNRALIDAILTATADKFSVKLEYVAGTEAKGNINGSDAKWSGINLQTRYAFSEHYALNLRIDQFTDTDGFRTGVKQTLRDVTITPEFTLSKNMVARVELRRDMSDKYVFDKKNKPASSKTQDTVALNAVYHF